MSKKRKANLDRFYALIDTLRMKMGPAKALADLSSDRGLPALGVYFFFEDGECRSTDGAPRVVRIGTHALKAGSKSTVRGRLGAHRGSLSGGGSHRTSIFRLLIGQAYMSRQGLVEPQSWGLKSSGGAAAKALGIHPSTLKSDELPIETEVSKIIGGMHYLVLDIPDSPGPESLRGYIERNAIALLSNKAKEPIDPATGNWLGFHSGRPKVRESGLWNQNHVDEGYDVEFLETMSDLIESAQQ